MDRIKRTHTTEGFTVLNNAVLDDPSISWKAKGLIAYMMKLPSDWEVNVADLKKRSKDGRDATTTGIIELMDHGYCRRSMLRDSGGRFIGYMYEVADAPIFSPVPENPESENPISENPEQLRTKSTKKRETKLSYINGELFEKFTEGSFSDSPFGNIEFFKKEFRDLKDMGIDVLYYYHAVNDWCEGLKSRDSRRRKSARGWAATVRNFIRRDEKDGKIKMLSNNQPLEYLNA